MISDAVTRFPWRSAGSEISFERAVGQAGLGRRRSAPGDDGPRDRRRRSRRDRRLSTLTVDVEERMYPPENSRIVFKREGRPARRRR